MTTTEISIRDLLLLAFAELSAYGIAARESVPGSSPARIGAEIAGALRLRSPYAMGSYVFWLSSDDDRFDDEGMLLAELPLFASAADVVRAVHATFPRYGLDVGPGDRPDVLMARPAAAIAREGSAR